MGCLNKQESHFPWESKSLSQEGLYLLVGEGGSHTPGRRWMQAETYAYTLLVCFILMVHLHAEGKVC